MSADIQADPSFAGGLPKAGDSHVPVRRMGLVAHRLHRKVPNGALLRWAHDCAAAIAALGLRLHAVGGTFDALAHHPALADYAGLVRYPHGRQGGLMRLVSHVAGALSPQTTLDGIFFFIDPMDPSSVYPEALALKRQCVIHAKPFIATAAGAKEWVMVELLNAGLPVDLLEDHAFLTALGEQGVALIAHDALKAQMVEFAANHFDLLSRFRSRIATGTTGGLLNELAWSRGWPKSQPWVTRFLSGPMGGDAQIAEVLLDGHCQKVIFFEDPHVARQHEADIQLMERAVCSAGEAVSILNTPAMARRWAQAMQRLVSR